MKGELLAVLGVLLAAVGCCFFTSAPAPAIPPAPVVGLPPEKPIETMTDKELKEAKERLAIQQVQIKELQRLRMEDAWAMKLWWAFGILCAGAIAGSVLFFWLKIKLAGEAAIICAVLAALAYLGTTYIGDIKAIAIGTAVAAAGAGVVYLVRFKTLWEATP